MSFCIRQNLAIWAILFLVGAGGCTQPSPRQGLSASKSAETVSVKRGNFRRAVRLNGSVSATESFSVLAPRLSGQMMGSGMMIITGIVHNGTTVHKGDILVEFDRQAQLKNILDRQAECDGLSQQIRKKQADQASAKLSDQTDIKGAEVDVQIALVEMRKNEVVPRYQAEINKANLAEAEAQLKQLKETFELKRKAEVADIRILEIQRDRALKALDYAKGNVERMTIRSPMDGLAVLTPTMKGTRTVDPQEGDEVRPGYGIMLVVNPAAMQVSARINQVDVWEVRPGQVAEVRLDAYPELVFPGKVERISAMSTTSSNSKRIRYFSTVVAIQGRNPRLLPDLTAAVDIRLQDRSNVLLLPREAVRIESGQALVMAPVNGKPEQRSVKIGPMNDSEVVIESGLDEGAIVLRHP